MPETEVEDRPPSAPRRRRLLGWLATVVVVALAAGGATVAVVRHRASAAAPAPVETPATAKVERRDLSTTLSLDGSVGYGTVIPLAGHKTATVTWLPGPGSTVKRGQPVYRADDRPVVLFYGALPLYRTIQGHDLAGRDVRVVADNLAALGYRIGRQPAAGELITAGAGPKAGPVRVQPGEGVLTAALTSAIKRWQGDLRLPVTGTVAVGDVEVQPGPVRVDSVTAQPGAAADAALLSVTSTRKVVTVNADPADAEGISRGDKATVRLPDDRTVPGRVTAVGRDLVDTGDAPKLAVTVTATSPKALAALDSGAVTVDFSGRTVKGVLAVPIEALVALAEGGYAVQGPAGLIAVKTGMFAGGWVQLSGAGLTAGMTVVVSS